MLLQIYLLLVVMATIATYLGIARLATYKISHPFAIFGYTLVAVASGNIEVVSHGSTLTFSNEYLFTLWGVMAFLNVLFLIVGPMEELAESGERSVRSTMRGD
jgi:hypothetical protein